MNLGGKMIIDCISDLHGEYPTLMGGDLLIIAGDLTARDLEDEYYKFNSWLCDQDYEKKVVIAGNHDGLLQKDAFKYLEGVPAFDYLCDTETEFKGLKIYGSPWTPMFCNWYFMKKSRQDLKEAWDKIPDDTDILVTHGPARGLLDTVSPYSSRPLGCEELRLALERVRPKLHVFGHIHGGYGKMLLKHEGPNTWCVNAALMNEDYDPVNAPIRIVL